MVLPLIAAGLGAAGSIAGGLMGANAQESANKTNQLINIMNAMMRQQERAESIEIAGNMRRQEQLGGIDARGNRTMWTPDRGWITVTSTDGEGLKQAQDIETGNILFRDLPMKRRQMERNYVDQLADREQEQKYIKELPYAKVDPSTIRSMLFRDAQSGINGSFDEATAAAMRGAVRRDPSAIGNILSSMARQKADATGDAFSKTGLQSLQLADQMTKANTGQLQNLINFFGGRARGLPAVSTPNAGNENAQSLNAADNLMRTAISASQNNEGLLANAFGKQGGTVDYITPNLGYANTVAQAGQSLGNIFKAFNSNNAFEDATKRFNASNSYG